MNRVDSPGVFQYPGAKEQGFCGLDSIHRNDTKEEKQVLAEIRDPITVAGSLHGLTRLPRITTHLQRTHKGTGRISI
jgi:hypothetical protein